MIFRIKEIKVNRIFLWQIVVVVFWAVFAIMAFLNIRFLFGAKDLPGQITEVGFRPKEVKRSLIDDVVSRIDQREAKFEEILVKKPFLADPSQ